jgi:hypothetical protein
MALEVRHRQQQLVRFLVQQELHLNHLEPMELAVQVQQQAELAVQRAQLAQVPVELASLEQPVLEELPEQLEELGRVLARRLNQQGRLAELML